MNTSVSQFVFLGPLSVMTLMVVCEEEVEVDVFESLADGVAELGVVDCVNGEIEVEVEVVVLEDGGLAVVVIGVSE
jgi:hypothetical protein